MRSRSHGVVANLTQGCTVLYEITHLRSNGKNVLAFPKKQQKKDGKKSQSYGFTFSGTFTHTPTPTSAPGELTVRHSPYIVHTSCAIPPARFTRVRQGSQLDFDGEITSGGWHDGPMTIRHRALGDGHTNGHIYVRTLSE